MKKIKLKNGLQWRQQKEIEHRHFSDRGSALYLPGRAHHWDGSGGTAPVVERSVTGPGEWTDAYSDFPQVYKRNTICLLHYNVGNPILLFVDTFKIGTYLNFSSNRIFLLFFFLLNLLKLEF